MLTTDWENKWACVGQTKQIYFPNLAMGYQCMTSGEGARKNLRKAHTQKNRWHSEQTEISVTRKTQGQFNTNL